MDTTTTDTMGTSTGTTGTSTGTTIAIDPGCHSMGVAITQGGILVEWRLVDLVPSVKKPPIGRIVQGAVFFVASMRAPDTVRIEQQPNQNISMKVLSHALQALFLAAFPDATVVFVNPRTYKPAGGTYASRKRRSVEDVTQRISADPDWGPVFRGHAKKDDLADALLLALWEP